MYLPLEMFLDEFCLFFSPCTQEEFEVHFEFPIQAEVTFVGKFQMTIDLGLVERRREWETFLLLVNEVFGPMTFLL